VAPTGSWPRRCAISHRVSPKSIRALLDIATEELSHLEVVGSIVVMLNQGIKGQMAEGLEAAELLANVSGGTTATQQRCSTAAGSL
jgi:Mn-containing catalase